MSIILWLIICVLALAAGFVGGYFIHRRMGESRLAQAEKFAEKIVAEAQREAATVKKEASVQAKEEWYKLKQNFEKETQSKRAELKGVEDRLTDREKQNDRKVDIINRKEREVEGRERDLVAKERVVRAKDERLTTLIDEQNQKLEQIAGLTQEEAKKTLLQNLEAQARHEAAALTKSIRDEARENAEKEAKQVITLAIQRYAGEHTAETTVSVVPLASDEMKGRIIGREGRNIRAFEAATGVEVLIDDTPEAIVISGFDPVRREVARIAMERLVHDGRIQPSRIEEVIEKAKGEVDRSIKEAGEALALEVGVPGLHPEVMVLLGRLKYRTSYGQNVLQHSKEVALLASTMAGELELDQALAKRAGLLHDLGKAVDHSVEGTHTQIGMELAKRFGESAVIINAIGAHHEDIEMISPISVLIAAADAISGARPGARRESLEAYIKRLEKLEEVAYSFKGVAKAYAIQAGREVRIIVTPEEVTDTRTTEMADEIARKVEASLQYPGQIKITVIRETRGVGYAK
ncbi:MAG: ribonuclease Y [Candidatus Edwardsbacteria bacterium]|jgi:ribonuclease Y|nr:ribonuclease Y [Candidatus Edwardsbacteria bacterium]